MLSQPFQGFLGLNPHSLIEKITIIQDSIPSFKCSWYLMPATYLNLSTSKIEDLLIFIFYFSFFYHVFIFIVLVIDDYTVYFIINLLFKTRFANGLQIFVKIQDLHSNEIHLSLAFIRAEKKLWIFNFYQINI